MAAPISFDDAKKLLASGGAQAVPVSGGGEAEGDPGPQKISFEDAKKLLDAGHAVPETQPSIIGEGAKGLARGGLHLGEAVAGFAAANPIGEKSHQADYVAPDPIAARKEVHEAFKPAQEAVAEAPGLQDRAWYDAARLASRGGESVVGLAPIIAAGAVAGPPGAAAAAGAIGSAEEYQKDVVADDPNALLHAGLAGTVDAASMAIPFLGIERFTGKLAKAAVGAGSMSAISIPQAGARAAVTGEDSKAAMLQAGRDLPITALLGGVTGAMHSAAPEDAPPPSTRPDWLKPPIDSATPEEAPPTHADLMDAMDIGPPDTPPPPSPSAGAPIVTDRPVAQPNLRMMLRGVQQEVGIVPKDETPSPEAIPRPTAPVETVSPETQPDIPQEPVAPPVVPEEAVAPEPKRIAPGRLPRNGEVDSEGWLFTKAKDEPASHTQTIEGVNAAISADPKEKGSYLLTVAGKAAGTFESVKEAKAAAPEEARAVAQERSLPEVAQEAAQPEIAPPALASESAAAPAPDVAPLPKGRLRARYTKPKAVDKTTNEVLDDWRRGIRAKGVLPSTELTESNMGGHLPPGTIKKSATAHWDQHLVEAKAMGLDVGSEKPEDFLRLMRGSNRTEKSAGQLEKGAEEFVLSQLSGEARDVAKAYGGWDKAVEHLKSQRDAFAAQGEDTGPVQKLLDEFETPTQTSMFDDPFHGQAAHEFNPYPDEEDLFRGPAKADTGIFDDIAAAAKQGKEWMADLHERIAPHLADLYQAGRTVKAFVAKAVKKFGEVVRPYAEKFWNEIKNAERGLPANANINDRRIPGERILGRANRGIVPTSVHEGDPTLPEDTTNAKETAALEAKSTIKSDRATNRANAAREQLEKGSTNILGSVHRRDLPKDTQTSNVTFAQGVKQGRPYGGLQTVRQTRDFWTRAKQLLAPDQYRLRQKAITEILRNESLTPEARQKKMDKQLEAVRQDMMQSLARKNVEANLKQIRTDLNKMSPSLQKFISGLLDTFREKRPTEGIIRKYEQGLLDLADGRVNEETIDPKLIDKIHKTIEDEIIDKPVLSKMNTQTLRALRDTLDRVMDWHKAEAKGFADILKQKKDSNEKVAPKDVAARRAIDKRDGVDGSMSEAFKAVSFNLSNLVRGLVRKDSYTYRVLHTAIDRGYTAAQGYSQMYRDGLSKRLQEAGLTSKKLMDMYSYPEKWGFSKKATTSTFKTEGGTTLKLTPGELGELVLFLRDPENRFEVLGRKAPIQIRRGGGKQIAKLTPADAADLEAAVTPDLQKAMDVAWGMVNQDNRAHMNDWSNRTVGYDIAKRDDYWPRSRSLEDKEPAIALQSNQTKRQFLESASQLQTRESNSNPVVIGDFMDTTARHLNTSSKIMGLLDPMVDARRLLDTSKFKREVGARSRTGADAMRNIEERLQAIGATSSERAEFGHGVTSMLARNLAVAKLMLNGPVALSQPFSVDAASAVIPNEFLLKAFTGHAIDAQSKGEIFQQAPGLRSVVESSGQDIINPNISRGGAPAFWGFEGKRATDTAMSAIHTFNDVAVYQIWRAARAWGQSQGLKGQDLMRFTSEKAHDAWMQTQPSGSPVYATGLKIAARTSSVARALTLFQAQQHILYESGIDAVRDWQEIAPEKRTTKDTAKMLSAISRRVVLQTALQKGAKYGWALGAALLFGQSAKQEERDRKNSPVSRAVAESVFDVIGSQPSSNVLVGLAQTAWRAYTTGSAYGAQIDDPIVGWFQDLFEAAAKSAAGEKGVSKNIANVADATGIPFRKVLDWLDWANNLQ